MSTKKHATKPMTNRSLAKSHGYYSVNLGVGNSFVKEFELEMDGKTDKFDIFVSSACDCGHGKLPKLDDYCNIYLSDQRLGCAYVVDSRDGLEKALIEGNAMIEKARAGGYPKIANHFTHNMSI